MINKKKIEITSEQLKYIYGQDYNFFLKKTLQNCYCKTCYQTEGCSTVVNYNIYINDLNDIILKGFCAKCKREIGRYLETGEVRKYFLRIRKIIAKLK